MTERDSEIAPRMGLLLPQGLRVGQRHLVTPGVLALSASCQRRTAEPLEWRIRGQ